MNTMAPYSLAQMSRTERASKELSGAMWEIKDGGGSLKLKCLDRSDVNVLRLKVCVLVLRIPFIQIRVE